MPRTYWTQLGAGHVLAAATLRQAFEEIARERPALALLDVNLGDQTSLPLADRLVELGVPFAFATGYGEQLQLPTAHEGVRVIQKPYSLEGVAEVLATLRR